MYIIGWSILFVVLVLTEAATMRLVSIWFAAGALVSLILAAFDVMFIIQIIAFIIVSAVLLVLTRPLVKKLMTKEPIPTNAELDIGKQATVTEEIDNAKNTGRVVLSGVNWTARSEDGSVFKTGEIVIVKRIESTTLYVEKEA